jgi:hypothetical protein
MAAEFPSEAKVWICAAGAAPSAGTEFTTYITAFKQSGGEFNTEAIPVFGGGNVEQVKPRSQIEVQLDFIMDYTQATLFDQLLMGSVLDGSSAVESKNDPVGKAVYLQTLTGTTYVTRAFNNAKATTFEPEMSADEYMKGTVTFKLPPTTNDTTPKSNMKVAKIAASAITWS